MSCSKSLDFATPVIPGAHLSFYWTMDEGGVLAKVDSTVGLSWPLLAGTSAAPGLFSNGTEIANKIRGIKITNSPSIVIDQTVSKGISFWYWVKVVSYGQVGVFCDLASTGVDTNELYLFLKSLDAVTTTVEMFHQNNTDSADLFTPALAWTLGTWHMVAGAYDKVAQTITIYIDGVQSSTMADAFTYGDIAGAVWGLFSPNPAGTLSDFVFDELGLCLNGALTAAQITSLWNGGAGVTWPNITPIVPYP